MNPMPHEGNVLRELLEKQGRTPADLARACNVTRTAVDRYLKAAKIGRIAWPTLRAGLVKMGIDPIRIKPDDRPPEHEHREDLRPLVYSMERSELEALKKILESPPTEREKLLWFIDGLLQHKR